MRLLPAYALLIIATSLLAGQTDTAVERFQSLQMELHTSHTAKDWHANLIAANELKKLLNDNPGSLLEVARAEAHVGDVKAALSSLDQFIRMGQSTDLLIQSSDFTAFLDKKDVSRMQGGMKANRTPISRGLTAFLLPKSNLLAEDVDYDSGGRRFLITSVRQSKIIATVADGPGSDFAKAPDNWPMLAIKIDRSRSLVWATENAIQGFTFARKSDWGRSAILCYDLKSGKLLRRIEGPRGSALGDLSLTANGDVVVSDGDGGGVYRLSGKSSTLERVDNGDFISPQTPVMQPDGKHMFVPDYERGIAILDLSTKRIHWLATNGRFALNGIDGLYFDRGRLIAVQNGTSPERVIVFNLDATLSKIVSETILERSTHTLGDPTHGVVLGKDFYYIANSGWDITDDRGNIKPGAKETAPRMMRVRIS